MARIKEMTRVICLDLKGLIEEESMALEFFTQIITSFVRLLNFLDDQLSFVIYKVCRVCNDLKLVLCYFPLCPFTTSGRGFNILLV